MFVKCYNNIAGLLMLLLLSIALLNDLFALAVVTLFPFEHYMTMACENCIVDQISKLKCNLNLN